MMEQTELWCTTALKNLYKAANPTSPARTYTTTYYSTMPSSPLYPEPVGLASWDPELAVVSPGIDPVSSP